MGFSRQEYRSGLPFPSPGDLPNPEIEPLSPGSAALPDGFFTTGLPGKPLGRLVCGLPNKLPQMLLMVLLQGPNFEQRKLHSIVHRHRS